MPFLGFKLCVPNNREVWIDTKAVEALEEDDKKGVTIVHLDSRVAFRVEGTCAGIREAIGRMT